MKAITQEQGMGCGVACVASLVGLSYKKAMRFFKNKKGASTRGYYCPEICYALKRSGKNYKWKKATKASKPLLQKQGVIVFIKRSKKYPEGHYLLRTANGWMDPWINYPNIKPAKAGIRRKLPGSADYIIFPS